MSSRRPRWRHGVVALGAILTITVGTVAANAEASLAHERAAGGQATPALDAVQRVEQLDLPVPLPTLPGDPSPSATPIPSTEPTTPGTPSPSPASGPPVWLDAHGNPHPAAPRVVRGNNRLDRFYGDDFDASCYDGSDFDRGMATFNAIARLIEQSGRRAVFTVAPNKSAVENPVLRGVILPHGACARRGMHHQNQVLDRYPTRNFIALRKTLIKDERRTYWPANGHWNTIGATDYALKLAQRLAPRVAARLRFGPTTDRLAEDLGDKPGPVFMRGPGLKPVGGVKVTPDPGNVDISTHRLTTVDHSWSSTPARRAMPGRTLLIGDSFTYLGLRSLRPIFAHGRFVWAGIISDDDLVRAILDSDTVVLEQVQRFVARSAIVKPTFTDKLRAALAAEAASR